MVPTEGFQRILFIGDYEIETAAEWESLLHILIKLQLRGLKSLLAKMKSIASTASREAHLPALSELDQRLTNVMNSLSAPR